MGIINRLRMWYMAHKNAHCNAEIVERLKSRQHELMTQLDTFKKYKCYSDAIDTSEDLDIIDLLMTGKRGNRKLDIMANYSK